MAGRLSFEHPRPIQHVWISTSSSHDSGPRQGLPQAPIGRPQVSQEKWGSSDGRMEGHRGHFMFFFAKKKMG